MKRYATSLAELAAIFGRAVPTIQKYGHLGCPCRAQDKDEKGRYGVTAIKKWLEANGYVETRRGRPAKVEQSDMFEAPAELKKAQAREKQARAELAEIELAEKRAEVVSVEERDAEERQRYKYVRAELLQWKRSLAPVLAGKTAPEILAIMDTKVDELMRGLSGQDKE